MRVLLRLIVAAATVPLALSSPNPFGAGTPGPRTGSDAIYRSSVRKALERAREELERSLELFVDHSTWDDPWVVEHGPFRVRSTAGWFFADRAARNLDTMVGHFEQLLGRPLPRNEVRNVFVFPDIGAYNAFGDKYGYHSSILGCFYAAEDGDQPIASYYHPNPVQVGMWLTHGATHLYVARLAPRALPTWMDEGLASYFSFYFWAYNFGVDELQKLQESGRYIPLDRLLRADVAGFVDDPHARFVELAMLFAFLIHFNEQTASPLDEVREGSFVEYLQKALRGERLTRHPFHAILQDALPQLEEDFRTFSFPRY